MTRARKQGPSGEPPRNAPDDDRYLVVAGRAWAEIKEQGSLFRAECLRAVGMHRLARKVETPTQRGPVALEEQIAAVDLEVELASSADQRRVWRAVAKTLRGGARRGAR